MRRYYITLYIDEDLQNQLDAFVDQLRASSSTLDKVRKSNVARGLLKKALRNELKKA